MSQQTHLFCNNCGHTYAFCFHCGSALHKDAEKRNLKTSNEIPFVQPHGKKAGTVKDVEMVHCKHCKISHRKDIVKDDQSENTSSDSHSDDSHDRDSHDHDFHLRANAPAFIPRTPPKQKLHRTKVKIKCIREGKGKGEEPDILLLTPKEVVSDDISSKTADDIKTDNEATESRETRETKRNIDATLITKSSESRDYVVCNDNVEALYSAWDKATYVTDKDAAIPFIYCHDAIPVSDKKERNVEKEEEKVMDRNDADIEEDDATNDDDRSADAEKEKEAVTNDGDRSVDVEKEKVIDRHDAYVKEEKEKEKEAAAEVEKEKEKVIKRGYGINAEAAVNGIIIKKWCQFYGSAAGCTNGSRCIKSHDNPNSVKMCKYWDFHWKAGCHFGNKCHFRHEYFNKDNLEDQDLKEKEIDNPLLRKILKNEHIVRH